MNGKALSEKVKEINEHLGALERGWPPINTPPMNPEFTRPYIDYQGIAELVKLFYPEIVIDPKDDRIYQEFEDLTKYYDAALNFMNELIEKAKGK